ncbi:hypothetical protein QBC32DRAFT_401711 [Pseudoneurospora amorphoporcata]|uniref:LysM domain-containing protein n=1 Tax=Pseudoneurospora amorphoporcata TaxID=241081 RepID=A0AAN6NK09_9PEZI|nr:hypothetical protein QBC32DRAFT_401711 [Pseudoneurospora amorphoporcata]
MASLQLVFAAIFLSHGHVAGSSDSYASITSAYGITSEQFAKWDVTDSPKNPSFATAYKLTIGNSYCIENNFSQDDPPTPSTSSSTLIGTTTTSTTASTTTGNGISTPTPIQEGMVSNYNKFHFIEPNQGCTTIGSTYGVSLAQLVAWNPAISSQYTGLWANTYLYISVVGSSTTLTMIITATTTTSSGNGITTPTPTQAGMVGNCDRFHLLDTYMYVRTIRFVPPKSIITTTTTKKTTSTTTAGVATPIPTQPGMVSGYKKFHKGGGNVSTVASGDQYGTIATRYSISLANFYSWNPAVGSNCQTFCLDYYVCVSR